MGKPWQEEKEIITKSIYTRKAICCRWPFLYINKMKLHFLSIFQKLGEANIC